MTQYEAIFIRRSVREYDPAPLTIARLAKIQSVLDNVKQLPGPTARFEIVNADKLKGAAAPHAILVHCEDTDAAWFNAGYSLQAVDLYLQAEGLGSIWMGMAKPIYPSLDYRILLAFGQTNVPIRTEADFKRKDIT